MSRSALLVLALAVAAPAVAAGGRAQLQAYFQTTLTNARYQQQAYAKVAKAWKQPAKTPALGRKTVVQAVIGRDGKLVSAAVSMESGSKAWDAAALAAVKSAAPFGPLPEDFAYPTVEVHFHVAWGK